MKTETKTLIKESFMQTFYLVGIGALGLFVIGIGTLLIKLTLETSLYYLFLLFPLTFLILWGLIFISNKFVYGVKI